MLKERETLQGRGRKWGGEMSRVGWRTSRKAGEVEKGRGGAGEGQDRRGLRKLSPEDFVQLSGHRLRISMHILPTHEGLSLVVHEVFPAVFKF